MLCVVGDLVEDVVVRPTGPHRPDTDNPAVIRRRRGGSAANVAEAAAVAGGRVRFIGRIGDDPLGERLVADLAAAGVDVRVQRAGRTGSIVVVVEPDEGRTMYPDRGAAAELGPIDGSWAEGVTWLHLPAYSLCAEPAAASTIAFADAVRGFYAYAVLEGEVELSPVAAAPDDDTVEQLVDHYRRGVGEHPDWEDFRRSMVADRRLVARLTPTHAYGMLSLPGR